MNILLGCEESQEVCLAFRAAGHEAFSCDILPCSGGHPEYHLQMSVYEALQVKWWDIGIFFTPCTYSCNSGIQWMYNEDKSINEERMEGCRKYAGMLRDMLNSYIPRVACENPIPHEYAAGFIGRRYDQIIQPYEFGHKEQKATCLWLKGLPKLKPTNNVYDEMMTLSKRERERESTLPCPIRR